MTLKVDLDYAKYITCDFVQVNFLLIYLSKINASN